MTEETNICYICDVCGSRWSQKELAEDCECSHKMPTGIESMKFTESIDWPTRVVLRTADGDTYEYAIRGREERQWI